mgnify:CR=1 FL=1
MAAISAKKREIIKGYIEGFIQGIVDEYKGRVIDNYAMPYNPYGVTKADYKWSQAKNYLPFNEAVVIGDEFWNIVGGLATYGELLEIYLEVGREKSKYMLDALAFGF